MQREQIGFFSLSFWLANGIAALALAAGHLLATMLPLSLATPTEQPDPAPAEILLLER